MVRSPQRRVVGEPLAQDDLLHIVGLSLRRAAAREAVRVAKREPHVALLPRHAGEYPTFPYTLEGQRARCPRLAPTVAAGKLSWSRLGNSCRRRHLRLGQAVSMLRRRAAVGSAGPPTAAGSKGQDDRYGCCWRRAHVCARPPMRRSGSAAYSGSWPSSVGVPLGQATARPQTSQIATSGYSLASSLPMSSSAMTWASRWRPRRQPRNW